MPLYDSSLVTGSERCSARLGKDRQRTLLHHAVTAVGADCCRPDDVVVARFDAHHCCVKHLIHMVYIAVTSFSCHPVCVKAHVVERASFCLQLGAGCVDKGHCRTSTAGVKHAFGKLICTLVLTCVDTCCAQAHVQYQHMNAVVEHNVRMNSSSCAAVISSLHLMGS